MINLYLILMEKKKIKFDDIKTSKNIFKKFMKIEHLVNFYNPYEKNKKR